MPDDIRSSRPLAPDFAPHRLPSAIKACADGKFLVVEFGDGTKGRFFALWLRENEVTPGIVDSVTREREIEIDRFPQDLLIQSASLDDGPAVVCQFSDGHVGRFDPGWLHSMAEGRWRPDFDIPKQVPWEASDMPEPPSFNGLGVLGQDDALDVFLRAAWVHGFVRLRDLPIEPGMVQRVGERIGIVRNSNFGFIFHVETKPDPDSTAYTSAALDGHTDLATRETQPGLQLLYCLENSATGGASTMADGFAVAEAIRKEDPEAFAALTELNWVFTNRHRETDYRFSGPILETEAGQVVEVRNTGFLRFFPDMSEADMPRAYRAAQVFNAMCRSDRFLCRTPFEAGDLILFDNRRMLHGRQSFDPQSGVRRLEGCYLDRDEMFSRLRTLARSRHDEL